FRGPGRRVEARYGGADEGGLDDVVTPAFLGRAVPVPDSGGHRAHHRPVGAQPGHVALQLLACVVAGLGGHPPGAPVPHASPAHQRVGVMVSQSSCRAPTEMPSARPTGIQPSRNSLAKSWPDRSEVNGRSRAAPAARTAVPIALNSSPPVGKAPMVRDTPTTPWPPSSAHSALIRAIAVRRASYSVATMGPKEPKLPSPETEVTPTEGAPKRANPNPDH